MKTQSGSILLPAMLFLSLAALITTMAAILIQDSFALQKSSIINNRSYELALSEIIESLGQPLASTRGLKCQNSRHPSPFMHGLCYRASLDSPFLGISDFSIKSANDKAIYPRFNFEKALANSFECKEVRSQLDRFTSSGILLSDASALWHQTCKLSKDINQSFVFIGNIETASQIQISALQEDQYLYLSAAGFININSSLETNHNLLILAGGDIIIQKLIASAENTVAIFSGSGSITIREISGQPKIRVFSPGEQRLGGIYRKVTTSNLPPIEGLAILGIM